MRTCSNSGNGPEDLAEHPAPLAAPLWVEGVLCLGQSVYLEEDQPCAAKASLAVATHEEWFGP